MSSSFPIKKIEQSGRDHKSQQTVQSLALSSDWFQLEIVKLLNQIQKRCMHALLQLNTQKHKSMSSHLASEFIEMIIVGCFLGSLIGLRIFLILLLLSFALLLVLVNTEAIMLREIDGIVLGDKD